MCKVPEIRETMTCLESLNKLIKSEVARDMAGEEREADEVEPIRHASIYIKSILEHLQHLNQGHDMIGCTFYKEHSFCAVWQKSEESKTSLESIAIILQCEMLLELVKEMATGLKRGSWSQEVFWK